MDKFYKHYFLLIYYVIIVFKSSSVLADNSRDNLRHIRDGVPPISMLDAERGWRRGLPNQKGNERSARPPRIPGLGPTKRDTEREKRDNQTDPAFDGCPEGSYRIGFAPDGLSFSILFDKFVAETTAASPQKKSVLRCHLILPIEIPTGYKMSITRLDYRGFANIPTDSTGVLKSTFSFQGESGGRRGNEYAVNLTYKFLGPISEDYTISSDVFSDQQAESQCGGTNNLRISNVLRIKNKTPTDAMLTIDSIDGRAQELVYFVNYTNCL